MNLSARISSALAALLLPVAVSAATFIVNSVADDPDSNLLDGVCKTAGNVCTLRAAIEQANQLSGLDTIQFNFGGAATTISPASSLPTITSTVYIDGYSNGSGIANTLTSGDNATLKVRIDGTNAGISTSGLDFGPGSSNSIVRGLILTSFRAHGISVVGSLNSTVDNITVAGNFIGTDGSGNPADANGDLLNWGAAVFMADKIRYSIIGGPVPADRNLLMSAAPALTADGVMSGAVAIGGGSVQNTVQNNYIGTDRSGNVARPNGAGIHLASASDSLIKNNVITGKFAGLAIVGQSLGNTIQGNFIGVGADGSTPIAGNGADARGVWMTDNSGVSPQRTQIGGANAGDGNVIAHWPGNGIRVEHSSAAVAAPASSRWMGNSIHSNNALGVEVIDATRPESSNPMQPPPPWGERFPLISSASGNGTGTQVNYALAGNQASVQYRVEVFANTSCDPTNFGEGQFVLGSATVTTDPAGNYSGAFNNLTPLFPGQNYVTMTATYTASNIEGQSSEFSQCVLVQKDGNPVGTPPTVAAGSASRPANQPFSLDLSPYVTATNGDPILFYGLLGNWSPIGLSFDPSTGVLSGTTPTAGIIHLQLTAADKDGTAWPPADFTLTITPADGGGNGDNPGTPGTVAAVPALDQMGLVLLGLLLAGFGFGATRLKRN